MSVPRRVLLVNLLLQWLQAVRGVQDANHNSDPNYYVLVALIILERTLDKKL